MCARRCKILKVLGAICTNVKKNTYFKNYHIFTFNQQTKGNNSAPQTWTQHLNSNIQTHSYWKKIVKQYPCTLVSSRNFNLPQIDICFLLGVRILHSQTAIYRLVTVWKQLHTPYNAFYSVLVWDRKITDKRLSPNCIQPEVDVCFLGVLPLDALD